MSAFRILVKNPIKKSFYEKRKKTINVLTVFSFLIKIMLKLFLITFLTIISSTLVNILLLKKNSASLKLMVAVLY